jgi:hypothetical protein
LTTGKNRTLIAVNENDRDTESAIHKNCRVFGPASRASAVNAGGRTMQIGIAAYLRNVAVRCNQISRSCDDQRTQDALSVISAELAEKAETLEKTFDVRTNRDVEQQQNK